MQFKLSDISRNVKPGGGVRRKAGTSARPGSTPGRQTISPIAEAIRDAVLLEIAENAAATRAILNAGLFIGPVQTPEIFWIEDKLA